MATENGKTATVDAKKKAPALTEEQKAAKREARKALRDYALSLSNSDKARALIFAVIGSGEGRGRKAGSGVTGQIYRLLKDKLFVSEMDLFKEFHIGRSEMRVKIRQFVNTKNPDNRIWVTLDAKKDGYSVVSVGKATPPNWTGPKPDEEKAL